MKLVIAVIRPDKLEDTLAMLEQVEVHLVTVLDARGRGRQKGVDQSGRTHPGPGNLVPKIQLEIAVNDEFLHRAIDALILGARTGSIGDGKIFILNLEECVRLRTGQTGGIAIG